MDRVIRPLPPPPRLLAVCQRTGKGGEGGGAGGGGLAYREKTSQNMVIKSEVPRSS